MHDKGGRSQWGTYEDESTSAAGSSKQPASSSSRPTTGAAPASSSYRKSDYGYAAAASGYVPAAVRTPSPVRTTMPAAATSSTTSLPTSATTPVYSSYGQNGAAKNHSQTSLALSTVSRVRALHSFEATEQGELTFEKGDIIKVVDRNYKDWWRGQLRGRTGIFPVNYVVRNVSFTLVSPS